MSHIFFVYNGHLSATTGDASSLPDGAKEIDVDEFVKTVGSEDVLPGVIRSAITAARKNKNAGHKPETPKR